LKRLKEAEHRIESVEASNNKGEGMSRKIGVKFKQSEPDASLSSGGEMEGVYGIVRRSESKPCIYGHGYEKNKFDPMGVRLLKSVQPGSLADPWEVSGWVEKMVGAVESLKVTQSGLVMFLCVSSDRRDTWERSVSCFVLRYITPLKGVICLDDSFEHSWNSLNQLHPECFSNSIEVVPTYAEHLLAAFPSL
jgi:hypothetical protein